jgi:hypothetical protein
MDHPRPQATQHNYTPRHGKVHVRALVATIERRQAAFSPRQQGFRATGSSARVAGSGHERVSVYDQREGTLR